MQKNQPIVPEIAHVLGQGDRPMGQLGVPAQYFRNWSHRSMRVASLLCVLSLLASAATAYAECAWVLWVYFRSEADWTKSSGR